MTALSDVRRGDQFLLAFRCTAVNSTDGLSLNVFSVNRAQAAQEVISPAGLITGQLAKPPDQIPVSLVTTFASVAIGDILSNLDTGETMVCRFAQMKGDGSVQWSSSPNGSVIYSTDGWSVIGHVDL